MTPRVGRARWALALTMLLGACDAEPGPHDASTADVLDGVRCADAATLERCEGGRCHEEACRGDELCQGSACVPWTEAALFADFTLTHLTTEPAVVVRVLPAGFPRAQVEALRFTFGDGVAGWGESLRHRYAAPGVYPVELEVRLSGHRVLRASKLAVIDPPAEHAPLVLTVNDLPAYLNGSVPIPRNGGTPDDPSDDTVEPFVLEVPRAGFTLDVVLLDLPEDPIDRASLSLVADADMGATVAGHELVDRLRFEEGASLGVARARWTVGTEEAAAEGPVTFTLRGRSARGRLHTAALTLSAVTLTAARDPFDRPMVWLFRVDTDFFDTRRSEDGALVSVEGSNGRPDFVEELSLIGAQGGDEALNARYLTWIEDALASDVLRYYGVGPDGTAHDDIPLTVVWQGRPGAPEPSAFDPAGDVSMMRFGGTFGSFLGFSGISPYNHERVDDSTPERGVATATLIGTLRTTPFIATTFAALDPERGQPVGSHPADAEVLDARFDPYAAHEPSVAERHLTLRRVARYLALAIGSVTAHEMGHAMGLVPNGTPPAGFFGDVLDVPFIDPANTDPHHADFPGLNLMQAGGGFTRVIESALASLELPRGADLVQLAEILALENRLSPYSRAYLQRRLTHQAALDRAPSGWRVGCR